MKHTAKTPASLVRLKKRIVVTTLTFPFGDIEDLAFCSAWPRDLFLLSDKTDTYYEAEGMISAVCPQCRQQHLKVDLAESGVRKWVKKGAAPSLPVSLLISRIRAAGAVEKALAVTR